MDYIKFTNLEWASVRALREVQSLNYKLEKLQEKIKGGIEGARKRYNDLHTKHLRDCGIAEQRELAKIEFGESLLKEK